MRNAKPGRHADGDGLYLLVKPTGSRTWLLRVQVDGKRRDIGLGSVDLAARASDGMINIPLLHRKSLSLSEARDKCAILRKAAEAGLDPVVERDRDRRGIPTFEQAAEQAYAALKNQWAPRQQEAFLSLLRRHAFPTLGRQRVDQIAALDIQDALRPIWEEIPDMARKVRHRTLMVLNFAHSKKWRPNEAPSKSVSIGLPKPKKGGNYAAMPYAEVPAFVAALKAAPETLGAHGAEAEAIADRLMTLPLTDDRVHGIFDSCPPEYTSTDEFADAVKRAAAEHYGHAVPALRAVAGSAAT